jgi:hypothetical protein
LHGKFFTSPHSRLLQRRFPPHDTLLLTREKYLVQPLLHASPQHCGGRAIPQEGDVCHRNSSFNTVSAPLRSHILVQSDSSVHHRWRLTSVHNSIAPTHLRWLPCCRLVATKALDTVLTREKRSKRRSRWPSSKNSPSHGQIRDFSPVPTQWPFCKATAGLTKWLSE